MVSHNPILRKRLTAERIAEAIHKAVSDQPMRQRAADLGPKIRAEAEIANAVVKTIEATRHESLGLRRVGWILFNIDIGRVGVKRRLCWIMGRFPIAEAIKRDVG